MSCATVLRDLVLKYQSIFQYEAAKFFAERLYYENPSPENLNLMAQCFFRMGKLKQTYHILHECTDPANRYLLALVCIAIGKLPEAERALSPSLQQDPEKLTQQQLSEVPEGAAGLYLLGRIARRGQCRDAALFYFRKAIETDPSCWSALKEYNEMGGLIDIRDVFGMDVPAAVAACGGQAAPPQSVGARGEEAAIQNLERQIMAENLGMSAHPSHTARHTAMSLGKSSVAMHIPFPHASSPQASVDIDVASRDDLDASLDVASPGLTPIGSQRPSLLLRGGHSAFPLTGDSNAAGYTPQSRSAVGNLANHSDYFAFAHSDADEKTDFPFSRGRRVSFGPPSRLSFSSYGAEEECLDVEEVPPSKYLRRSRALRGEDEDTQGGMLGSLGSPNGSQTGEKPKSGVTAAVSAATRGRASLLPAPTTPTRTKAVTSAARMASGPVSPLGSTKYSQHSSPPRLPDGGIRSPPRRLSLPASTGPAQGPLPASTANKVKQRSLDINTENRIPPNQNECEAEESSIEKQTKQSYAREKQKAKALVALFATAQQLLCTYQCKDALDILRLLPKAHQSSGLANQMIGVAYFEMGDYRACLLAMREMLRLEPYRIQGTETMSTALWHMKSKKELCALGQQVVDIDKFAPETWCVVGNCFSLQQEHDTAIRFFERSIQIDQWFAYAHTLCGHEHVFNENLDKAMICFRSALKIDHRHYNAWYGMGSIFYRQERLELAEYHFRKAADINKRSAVLQCYLGIVLYAQNNPMKTAEAKQMLKDACIMDPKNPQIHFQLAHIQLACALDEDDLIEVENRLNLVRDLAPREPPVFVMLGQVCQRLGKVVEALGHFNAAIDLDPKQSSSLKLILDEIGGRGGEEDIMDLGDEL